MTITDTKPEVEFDKDAHDKDYSALCDAYRHEDGSITYIVTDMDGEHANPREYDGNIATFIQENDHFIAIDSDDAGLKEARDHFYGYGIHRTTHPTHGIGARSRYDRNDMMQRYISIFRPDILHYEDWCDFGGGRSGSYGWGYVTKGTWDEHMYRKPPEDATDEELLKWVDEEPSVTPEEAFEQERDLYAQWANGEVYGAIHVSVGKPIVEYGEHGAYVDEYDTEEDSCWGFLGYADRKEIAESMTSSPVTEVLY